MEEVKELGEKNWPTICSLQPTRTASSGQAANSEERERLTQRRRERRDSLRRRGVERVHAERLLAAKL